MVSPVLNSLHFPQSPIQPMASPPIRSCPHPMWPRQWKMRSIGQRPGQAEVEEQLRGPMRCGNPSVEYPVAGLVIPGESPALPRERWSGVAP